MSPPFCIRARCGGVAHELIAKKDGAEQGKAPRSVWGHVGDGEGDVSERESSLLSGFKLFFRRAFLPEGFPQSVSADYVRYQVFDSLQALCSGASGFLAAQAVLAGAGVGDAAAIPLAAALQWALRDGTGMVGRVLFAWKIGSELDARAKQWRLAADVLNDAAMALDLVSGNPALRPWFGGYTGTICLSALLRSIVGVAGGATRAAVTQHQARANNTADLSAKDGAQETLNSLAGMLIGVALAPVIESGGVQAVWLLFVGFTLLHILANYFAVRSLVFASLNMERCRMVVCDMIGRNGEVLSRPLPPPESVNKAEQLWVGLGRLRAALNFNDKDAIARRRTRSDRPIRLGASFQQLGAELAVDVMEKHEKRSFDNEAERIRYVIVDQRHATQVMYLESADRHDVFRSFVHVLLRRLGVECAGPFDQGGDQRKVDELIDTFQQRLRDAGWQTDWHSICAEEWRVSVVQHPKKQE